MRAFDKLIREADLRDLVLSNSFSWANFREYVTKKEVELKFVKSQDQIADIFTKPLKEDVFCKLRSLLRVEKKNHV